MVFIFKAFSKVYHQPRSWIITIVVALLYLLVAIWIPQWSLISYTLFSPVFDASQKASILYESFGWFVSGNTLATQILMITTSVLVGVNMAFLVHYVSLRIRSQRLYGASLLALVSGVLGVGCGACGSVLLSSIFGITLATGIAGALPLKGLEFGLLSILILIGSIVYIAYSMNKPLTCKT